MAYDKEKAHEYYVKYRKKGLKKGRKKGTGRKKKGTTSSLLGVSIAGLNPEGKVEAALIKDRVKKEMNEKLKGAKTDAEREQIRREYSLKAVNEIANLKNDAKYAKPKAVKAAKAPKAAKTSSSKSLGSKSSSKGSSSSSSSAASQISSQVSAAMEASMNLLTGLLTGIAEKIAVMTQEQKTETKTLLENIVAELQKKSGTNVDEDATTKKLQEEIDKLRV